MAKVEKTKLKKGKADDSLPFERENYIIVGVGILTIILGYIALAQDGVEGFMPLTVAPILLLIGYCIIVPIGIMYRKKDKPVETSQTPAAQ